MESCLPHWFIELFGDPGDGRMFAAEHALPAR